MKTDAKKATSIALKKAQTSIVHVIKMLEEDRYCIDILQQILAIDGLLKAASNRILENHLNTCFKDGIETKSNAKKTKLIKEVIDVIKIGNKK